MPESATYETPGPVEENWRDAGAQDRNFLESESPLIEDHNR